MSLQLFFQPEVETGQLNEVESRHCAKVLRKKEGDLIALVDGKGNRHDARLTLVSPKKCLYAVQSVFSQKVRRPFQLSIAIAPTKNMSRFEWFLEKATEIGIDHIYPVMTRYSERKKVNLERCNKILIAAMKQSNRLFLPRLHPLKRLEDFIIDSKTSQQFIACIQEEKGKSLGEIKATNTTVLIGPEGGFSTEEISLAKTKGWSPLSLGEHRLRTETAGVVVVSQWNALF